MMNLLPELVGKVNPTALLATLIGVFLVVVAFLAMLVFGPSGEPVERVVAVLSAIGDMIARANGH
ncbi:hypothetical protein [Pseudoclavibacter sp. RFBA6]|uniref:hypothetical protein n=1 Tax=Pseudoclavibacter sp. RFBA6 TaxID=2080573 RepID=UPI000CE8B3BB|nr:hypothetical protein [Pseudoclavibacter sp. RFBA6]PPG38737.1 hypothetical protein C5C17_13690 [Pseudoclavibacter sp. RFBA6]